MYLFALVHCTEYVHELAIGQVGCEKFLAVTTQERNLYTTWHTHKEKSNH